MRAISLRLCAELRWRWRAWVGLALLMGIAGGLVIAAAAGFRRTDTAYARFLRDQRAFDAIVFPDFCPSPEELAPGEEPYECDVAAAANLDAVRESAEIVAAPVAVFTQDGRALDPGGDAGYTGLGEASVLGSTDGFGTAMNRPVLLDGRLPDPEDPHEALISTVLARRRNIAVGDRLRTSRPEGANRSAKLELRVVGIEVSPFEVAPPSGEYLAVVHITPAATRDIIESGADVTRALAVRLVDGDGGIGRLRRELDERRIAGAVVFRQADQAEAVERAIEPEALALAIAAAFTGLALIAVLGSVLGRHAWAAADGLDVMWALGLRRRQLMLITLLRAGFIGAVAALVAVAVAVVTSPMTPIGLARDVEPQRGIAFDTQIVLLGAVMMFGAVLALVVWPAWRIARSAGSAHDGDLPVPSSPVTAAAVRAGFSAADVTGIRMALDPGRGRRAVPTRSGFVGVTVGVLTMTAVLGFSASLDHLGESPRLLGYSWDALVFVGESAPSAADLEPRLEQLPKVAQASIGTAPIFTRPFPDHPLLLGDDRMAVELIALGPRPIAPQVIDGRAPARAREILVGTETLDDLGLEIGDRVPAFGQVGESDRADAYAETKVLMRIVGTGAVPAYTGDPATAGRVGRGALVTMDGLRLLNPVFEPEVVFVTFAEGTARADGFAAIRRFVGRAGGDDAYVLGDVSSEELHAVLVISRVDELPLILAGLMAAVAAALLAHVLVTSVRMRRLDFAVLRAIGFRGRDLRRVVTLHAATLSIIAIAIGVPFGALLGGRIWTAYARGLGVVPEEAVAPEAIAGAIIGGVLVACAVAFVPGRMAARLRPAAVLRAE